MGSSHSRATTSQVASQHTQPCRGKQPLRGAPTPAQSNQAIQRLLRSGLIQPKLTVNRPGDQFEQEADRVADEIMRMPEPKVQRACAACDGGKPCPKCAGEESVLRRKAKAPGDASHQEAPDDFIHDLGSGAPLEVSMRAFMEPRFGQDFSKVRLHTDARASESAWALNAVAYTVGRNVVFAAGQYSPGTSEGRRLIAHELTHVLQQVGNYSALHGEQAVSAGTVAGQHEASGFGDLVTVGRGPQTAGKAKGQPLAQRKCGTAINAPPTPACIGETVDPLAEIFRFKVNCDEIEPSEATHVTSFVSGLSAGTTVRVHGYASTDGPPAFNVKLSCHRANEMARILRAAAPAITITEILEHGPTPGPASMRRAAWVETISPTPQPPPPPPPVVAGCRVPVNPDRSGSADNPTTDGENVNILKNPIDAFSVDSCRDKAFAAAGASGLIGAFLGPQDAFRHCFWNCCMAQSIGVSQAEKFATAHENSNPSTIPFDNQMDLHDNVIGRSLGTPGADCEAECKSAVSSGLLRTVRQPPTVPTGCIGPSNQPWP